VGWTLLSDGLIDRNGKPIGTDFSSFYAAGSLVLGGRAGDVCNMAAHYAREHGFPARSRLRPRGARGRDCIFVRHDFRYGFRSFVISVLAAAWIVPLLSRGIAGDTGIPRPLVLLALYVFTLRRAMSDREHVSVAAGRHGIAQA